MSSDLLLPAEANEVQTRELIKETHRNFLSIGKLLLENKEKAYWSNDWNSFSDYIESLGISKSAGYSMIASYEFQSIGKLTEPEILEIGIAKMPIVIAIDKQNKLTDEIKELAKSAPVRDFKEALGHKIIENNLDISITCPKCGEIIRGAQWVKKPLDKS